MSRQKLLMLLSALSLTAACRSTLPASSPAAGLTAKARSPLELTIKPAAVAAKGGQRLPVQFTVRNTGDQPIHTCLSAGRVVHLWGLDRKYAYTVAEEGQDKPSCTETLDLAPHSEHSWSEEIAIPAISASSAKIVAFAQVVPPDCGPAAAGCAPLWLSAAYAPFTIEEREEGQPGMLDLRTGAKLALAAAPPEPAPSPLR
jgi:hypothetical protein